MTTSSEKPQRTTRPTLRDVAREANLSVTQTSRALNGHHDVAEATRKKAHAAAKAVGYLPNLEARRLKNPDARSQSIGLVLSSPDQRFSDPFLGELLAAISNAAALRGYELQLTTPHTDEDVLDVYRRAIATKRVDGYILLRVALDDPRVQFLSSVPFPFVTLGQPTRMPPYPTVSNGPDALMPAIAHLVELGHTRISAVALPSGYAIAEQRQRSFLAALEQCGLDASPNNCVPDSGYHEIGGFETARRLLDAPAPPTAIVGFNDLLTLGALRATQLLNLTVPRDLSLISFDDNLVARYAHPRLTALHLPVDDVGSLLVDHLIDAIDDKPPRHATVTPKLVVRDSTAPPHDRETSSI